MNINRKILFTVTNDLTYDQRMRRICTALCEHKYDVTIIGRVKKDSSAVLESPYNQVRMPMMFQKGIFFYVEYSFRVFFWMLFHKTDIICSVDTDTLLPCYLVSKLRGKILVFDSHEHFTETEELLDRPLVRSVWKTIERAIIPRIKYAYTVSQSIADDFKHLYRANFSVIMNVPYLSEHDVSDIHKDYFIYVGAVNKGRGLEACIEAIKDTDVKMYICGYGDCLEELKAKTKELSVESQVTFTGHLTPAELRFFTSQAFAGLLVLDAKGKSYQFSLANKFFDYIHAQIPQITIRLPEYDRINNEFHVSILVDHSVDQIRSAMHELMTNTELYKSLKQGATDARKKYNWQNEALKLVTFYDNVR